MMPAHQESAPARVVLREAIILAGGLGTRLADAAPGVPKALADVAGKPFLHWQLEYLQRAGFERIVLATGYRSDQIVSSIGKQFGDLEIAYARESSPLGTGGAIRSAFGQVRGDGAHVFNGDTLAMFDAARLEGRAGERLVIAIAHCDTAQRYGALVLEAGHATGMLEPGYAGPAWINAGAYWLARDLLQNFPSVASFSFEGEFLRLQLPSIAPRVVAVVGPMIDIGTGTSLEDAQRSVPELMRALPRPVAMQPSACPFPIDEEGCG